MSKYEYKCILILTMPISYSIKTYKTVSSFSFSSIFTIYGLGVTPSSVHTASYRYAVECMSDMTLVLWIREKMQRKFYLINL